MKVFKAFGIAVLLLSFVLVPQIASAIGFEAAVGVWNQSPSGDIAYKGASLDLGNDLKYSDKVKPFVRAKLDIPVFPNIYVMATPMSFDGNGSKNASFVFGDKTYSANTSFSSELTLDHYDVAFYYGLPFVKTATLGKLNVDAGLNFRFIDVKAEVKQGSTHESKSFWLPLPMAYVGAQLKPVKDFAIEAEIRGIALSGSHFYDLIGRLKYNVVGPAFIAAGYRHEDVKIDSKDVKANLKFSGPFVEAGVKF